jgi:D-tyrosyl-tRNA(Tyr) deacylase
MKAVIQRVSIGKVDIPSESYSASIEKGMVVLLGIKVEDTVDDALYVADKCSNLRIFEDENGKMNLSLNEIGGESLVISQFTLYGDTQKGSRPSFIEAARPENAIPLYEKFIERMKKNIGSEKVKCGIFGTMMKVTIINDGPVTVFVESKQK